MIVTLCGHCGNVMREAPFGDSINIRFSQCSKHQHKDLRYMIFYLNKRPIVATHEGWKDG